MKTKAFTLITLAAALIATAACTNDDNNLAAVDNNTRVAARITAAVTHAAVATPGAKAGLTDAGTPAAITPCTVTAEEKYEAILLPVGSLTDAHTVTFTTDKQEEYIWTVKKQIPEFEAGKIYTYDVTVTKHAVTANGSINDWEVGSEGSGIAD